MLIYFVSGHEKMVNQITTQRVKNTNTEMEQHKTRSKSSMIKTLTTPLWGRANGSRGTEGLQKWTCGNEADRNEMRINKKNNEIQSSIEHVSNKNN